MTTDTLSRLHTVEEFLALEWSDEDDNQYELIEGEIVPKEKPGPGAKHAEVVTNVSYYLKLWAGIGETSKGKTFSGGACTLGLPQGSNYVVPDACFIVAGRMPLDYEDGPIPVAPDLVVEVNSPSDTMERIHNKLIVYRNSGVQLVWSVNLLDKYVLVYRLNDPDVKLLNLNEELDGETILPGFKLKVKALFE